MWASFTRGGVSGEVPHWESCLSYPCVGHLGQRQKNAHVHGHSDDQGSISEKTDLQDMQVKDPLQRKSSLQESFREESL
jgi:hypothetical protein